MPSLDRQMDTFERSRWCLWTLGLLCHSLFLIATQTLASGSSIIWATGASALVVSFAAILIAVFEHWPTWRETWVNLLFVSAAPALSLLMLAFNDVTWTVSWAAFEALGAALMAMWAIFDILVLKPGPTTESFDDVVNDARHNAGV